MGISRLSSRLGVGVIITGGVSVGVWVEVAGNVTVGAGGVEPGGGPMIN